MQFGQKAQGKALTTGELRKLVKQLDAAGVQDAAIVRGRARVGGKMIELSVESGEMGAVPASFRPEPQADTNLLGPADPC